MNVLEPGYLFGASIFIYLAAVMAALFFYGNEKISTLISQGLCMVASLFGVVSSLMQILSGGEQMVLQPFHSSIPYLDVTVSMDSLSAFFVLILSILVFCISLYSIGYLSHYFGKRNVSVFHVLYVAFILSMLFVFTAANAVFFFMAWEAMAIISYFLVVFESEHADTRKAGLIYIVMTHISTALIMIAFMIMLKYTGSFDINGSSTSIPDHMKNVMFLLFLIGFGTKGGIAPMHIWLPHAHPAAPGTVSALMSGVMIKTAIYGMIRFILMFLGVEVAWWGYLILALGAFSALFGVLYAFIAKNIKRMLAHSSIENMGIIFVGIGISFIAFSKGSIAVGSLALLAALLHSFNHALFKGSLFLGVASIHYATHTKSLENLGGLIKLMPVTSVFFLGGALSLSAIVPFNGFISEWLTYQSIFASIALGNSLQNIIMMLTAAVLAMTGALAAASMIKLFGIAFLGRPRTDHASKAEEVPTVMNIGTGILVVLCLLGGLFPRAFLNILDPVVSGITGFSVADQLQGSFLAVYYPLTIQGNAISPLLVFISIAVLVLITLVMLRAIGGTYTERVYGTWDCGFKSLTARMQYSANAFSNPIKIVFGSFFKSSREFKVSGDAPYHPVSMEFTVTTESPFEKYIYVPLMIWITAKSHKLKLMIQTGSVHTYLLYIFIAVLVLMLYNKIA